MVDDVNLYDIRAYSIHGKLVVNRYRERKGFFQGHTIYLECTFCALTVEHERVRFNVLGVGSISKCLKQIKVFLIKTVVDFLIKRTMFINKQTKKHSKLYCFCLMNYIRQSTTLLEKLSEGLRI